MEVNVSIKNEFFCDEKSWMTENFMLNTRKNQISDGLQIRGTTRNNCFCLEDFAIEGGKSTLGKGSYGEVSLARHVSTNVLCALKEIKKNPRYIQADKVLIENEILAHKSILHPNIIQLYGEIDSKKSKILVLEYADGGTLFSALKQVKSFPEIKAYTFFSQICAGVQYLHRLNMIHRDIKLENILLLKDGSVKICDFGWCSTGDTARKTCCGTLDYMAPEILVGKKYINKVDVWALGVLLYELIQGSPPFPGRNTKQKLESIEKGIVFSSSFSTAAKEMIRKLLCVDPEERLAVEEIFGEDWMIRYTENVDPKLFVKRKIAKIKTEEISSTQDLFDIKISKNYPTSYKKKRINSIQIDSDSFGYFPTTPHTSYMISSTPKTIIKFSQSELENRKKELLSLQKSFQSPRLKKKSFFGSLLSKLSLSNLIR